MVKVSWTEQTLDDVESIADFISKDSLKYAQLFVDKIFNSVEVLIDFPLSGRIVPELDDKSIREIILGSYRIIYRIKSEEVEIITVYHSARLLNL